MKLKYLTMSLMAIAFTLCNVTNATAQLRFGVKGEVGVNKPSFNKSDLKVDNLTSFSVGPTMEFMMPLAVVNLGVDAALLYNDNRMEVNEFINGSPLKQEISNRYLKLPVNAKVKYPIALFPLSIYAVAGPYASYLISGDKIDFETVKEDIEAKQFEAGAQIGLGVEVLKMLQVGISYSTKLTNNYSLEKPEWEDALNSKSGDWLISATLFF